MKNFPITTKDDMARCNLTFEPAAAIIAPLTGYGCADSFRLIAAQQPPGFVSRIHDNNKAAERLP